MDFDSLMRLADENSKRHSELALKYKHQKEHEQLQAKLVQEAQMKKEKQQKELIMHMVKLQHQRKKNQDPLEEKKHSKISLGEKRETRPQLEKIKHHSVIPHTATKNLNTRSSTHPSPPQRKNSKIITEQQTPMSARSTPTQRTPQRPPDTTQGGKRRKHGFQYDTWLHADSPHSSSTSSLASSSSVHCKHGSSVSQPTVSRPNAASAHTPSRSSPDTVRPQRPPPSSIYPALEASSKARSSLSTNAPTKNPPRTVVTLKWNASQPHTTTDPTSAKKKRPLDASSASSSPSTHPPSKRSRNVLDPSILSNEAYVKKNMSSIIAQIMGVDRRKFRSSDDDMDDEACMEVSYLEAEREERRSERIARAEDEEEEWKDRQRRLARRKLKGS